MQTVWDSIQLAAPHRPHRGIARGVIAGFVGLVVLVTSSCSPADSALARVEGRAEQETELSPCEVAYQGAQQDRVAFDTAISSVQRSQASRSASEHWIAVAANCTGRFAEGSMNSALALYALSRIEGTSPFSDAIAAVPSDAIAGSHLSSSEASAIALAEDRAGFGIEVLASRSGASSDSLRLSDNHKALAQSLVSLHPETRDPREKVYAVQQLLAHPATITDPVTGLSTTTSGQIEMDTARAIVEAMTATRSSSENDTDGDDPSASASSSSSNSTSTSTSASSSNRNAEDSIQALTVAARITASRAATAFALGFPAFRAAVLTPARS
ncbi:hypothetical protein [Bifidobacterium crudilactis]|uniref:hypothetical protein n=1 Tax=Bifidobacterium crudilactis TaxID=327277 RepID=UPI000553DC76|nr:hypothetical protein [Bifidobacterium crudilactis]MCI2148666.1 hypothetical protein [Bifidobacterium crudilactis]MCI2157759.1 hypothetical protein [Bifidobacterium crudilactis]